MTSEDRTTSKFRTASGILIGILAVATSSMLGGAALAFAAYVAFTILGAPFGLDFFPTIGVMGGSGLIAGGAIGLLWTRALLRS